MTINEKTLLPLGLVVGAGIFVGGLFYSYGKLEQKVEFVILGQNEMKEDISAIRAIITAPRTTAQK